MTATPLLGIIIPQLPLFLIHYHTCDLRSKNDPDATIFDRNATDSDPLKFSDPMPTGGCPPGFWAVAPQLMGAGPHKLGGRQP